MLSKDKLQTDVSEKNTKFAPLYHIDVTWSSSTCVDKVSGFTPSFIWNNKNIIILFDLTCVYKWHDASELYCFDFAYLKINSDVMKSSCRLKTYFIMRYDTMTCGTIRHDACGTIRHDACGTIRHDACGTIRHDKMQYDTI